MRQGLSGLRVVSFESRRSAEMAELIRNYGGEPIQAPSLREVPLADQHEALAFGEALLAGDPRRPDPTDRCRDPNANRHAVNALAEGGRGRKVGPAHAGVPRAQTDRGAQRGRACRGARGARAEHVARPARGVGPYAGDRGKARGRPGVRARNEELLAGLRQRGARVSTVPVYGWALPEDTAPLRAAIERVMAREVEVALFSSATQVGNVFCVAVEMGRAAALREMFRARTVVASIGPITTAALQDHGVEPDLHPEHPKMGHLVAEVARRAAELLERKRRGPVDLKVDT
jgi:uroporphyrinogen-III synthase